MTLERAEIVRRVAVDFNAVLVDYWIWDGVHPTVFGDELMVREWIKQVGKRIPSFKVYK